MTEAVLKYAWKYRYFNSVFLKTTSGSEIKIIRPGSENTDAGPDFFLSEVEIDGTRWVGNVEMHVRSSDWISHGHQKDKAYSNVILHVVYQHDTEIKIGSANVPTLELSAYLGNDFIKKFDELSGSTFKGIPCEKFSPDTGNFKVSAFLRNLVIERLIQKEAQIRFIFEENQHDLQDTFYQWLFIGFGQKVNKHGFHQLSRRIPFSLARKYAGDETLLSALLFGTSGMLPAIHEESYVKELISEFYFLALKHEIQPMEGSEWKFLRMRPSGFPTIRLAQLVRLLCSTTDLTSMFESKPDIQLIRKRISATSLPGFWNTHYSFTGHGPDRIKTPGEDFLNHLLVNVIIPFRFFRMRLAGENSVEEPEELLSALDPEDNAITRKMAKAGFANKHAGDSQALLQLHNLYCDSKKCLLCTIGYQILRN